MKNEVFQRHAEICKVFSHPKRLEILNILGGRELSVGEVMQQMEIREANLSQHLFVLRQRGVVTTRREGQTIFYKISNPKILQACNLMREVLFEQFKSQGRLLKDLSKAYNK
ncbi:MAG: metalloregulator ArsR/SmtB family transcription factor [Firmicutes bacterium]|nr:metalloregulator ArsR/SmtB family transcription factor [Bacillota bacterium]